MAATWHGACNPQLAPFMRLYRNLNLLLIAAFLGSASALVGAEAKAAAAAKESAVKSSASGSLRELLEQVSTQRERMIADHESLARQLKAASDEQRKAILEKMQEQKRVFEAAQSALHKQIRDEQRRQRQGAAPRR